MNCLEEYVAYLKDNPEKYWFKRKLYGYGWTPAKKEGWVTFFVYLAVVLGLILFLPSRLQESQSTVYVIVPVIVTTFLFIGIAWKKGESLKWQWGNKHDEK